MNDRNRPKTMIEAMEDLRAAWEALKTEIINEILKITKGDTG